jgi:hypothetical protein
MSPLTGTDLYDWIGLRRVNGGRLVKLGQRWLHSGHPVPDYVAEALTALHTRGFVTLTGPDPKKGVPDQVMLTHDGTVRYQQLCRQRLSQDRASGPASAPPAGPAPSAARSGAGALVMPEPSMQSPTTTS